MPSTPLRRRQEAARRLPPLPCGCRDPWPCSHRLEELDEARLDAAEAAKQHLAAAGLLAVLSDDEERALRHRSVRRRLLELASA